MADTVLLAAIIICLLLFLLYIAFSPGKFSKRTNLLIITASAFVILALFIFIGFKNINSDISRMIKNSSPKTPDDVYSLLFKKPINNCMTTLNFKDQIVPKLDCCIWMEVRLCPAELTRLIRLKNYQSSVFGNSDSSVFLKPFIDKPVWWRPQDLGDTVIKLNIQFNHDNQQTLFFGKDSSHVYICDQAL